MRIRKFFPPVVAEQEPKTEDINDAQQAELAKSLPDPPTNEPTGDGESPHKRQKTGLEGGAQEMEQATTAEPQDADTEIEMQNLGAGGNAPRDEVASPTPTAVDTIGRTTVADTTDGSDGNRDPPTQAPGSHGPPPPPQTPLDPGPSAVGNPPAAGDGGGDGGATAP